METYPSVTHLIWRPDKLPMPTADLIRLKERHRLRAGHLRLQARLQLLQEAVALALSWVCHWLSMAAITSVQELIEFSTAGSKKRQLSPGWRHSVALRRLRVTSTLEFH